MAKEDWTPIRGWAIGLGKAAWKSALAGIIAGGVGYLLMSFVLSTGGRTVVAPLLIGAIVGSPLGWFVSRKLVEDSGLVGSVIGGPVVGMMLAAESVACWVAWAILGVTGLGPWAFMAGVMVLSAVMAAKAFILDS